MASPISKLRTFYRSEEAMDAVPPQVRVFVEWLFSKASDGDLMTSNGRLTAFINASKKGAKGKKGGKGAKSADKKAA